MIKNKRWSQLSVLEVSNSQQRGVRRSRFSIWGSSQLEYFPTRLVTGQFSKNTPFLIFPENKLLILWTFISTIIIILQAFCIPFVLAFQINDSSTWLFLEVASCCFFLAEMLLNFNIAIYKDGTLVEDRKEIRQHYMKNWFIVDAISLIPIATLPFFSLSRFSRTWASFLQYVKLLALFRLLKLRSLSAKLQERISSKLLSTLYMLAEIMIIELFIAHILACSFYAIGIYESTFYPNVWMTQIHLDYFTIEELYITALYWSITTMATVGYGDVKPITPSEVGFVVAAMILACIVFGYIIGAIEGVILTYTSASNKRREMLVNINDFMKRRGIPIFLVMKVRRYLDYIWEVQRKNEVDETEVLAALSNELRELVFIYSRGFIFNKCPGFSKLEQKVLKKTALITINNCYAPNDVIFEEGEKSRDMYFIQEGEVYLEDQTTRCVLRKLQKLNYFGEIAFFLGTGRTCSAVALSFLQAFTISYKAFKEILDSEPETKKYLADLTKKPLAESLEDIEIDCFLCSQRGHIAKTCEKLNYDRKEHLRAYLDKKKDSKHIKIKREIIPRNIPPKFLSYHPRLDSAIAEAKTVSFSFNSESLLFDKPESISSLPSYERLRLE
jgi:CRP-like cAMP-binding protein